ncbi:MAG: YraN family protein [Candidatus Latescibacteria bacterium]|nr:YraN family protein [Candidatus Latescibacterota bacterium]
MSSLGKQGEELAVKYLKSIKYKILDKNYRCTIGEIDIVAKEKATIVFIEVKTRRSADAVEPFESVGKKKQEKIRALAEYYLQEKDYSECEVRFDVLSIVRKRKENWIEHIQDAF